MALPAHIQSSPLSLCDFHVLSPPHLAACSFLPDDLICITHKGREVILVFLITFPALNANFLAFPILFFLPISVFEEDYVSCAQWKEPYRGSESSHLLLPEWVLRYVFPFSLLYLHNLPQFSSPSPLALTQEQFCLPLPWGNIWQSL